jgi:hypothetical protein
MVVWVGLDPEAPREKETPTMRRPSSVTRAQGWATHRMIRDELAREDGRLQHDGAVLKAGVLETRAGMGQQIRKSSQVAIPNNALCIKQRASSIAEKINAQA